VVAGIGIGRIRRTQRRLSASGADSVLAADPDLAGALDDQQYYWAETRPELTRAGIAPLDQPGRRFLVREPGREWAFEAAPDSSPIGYAPRVLYRLWLPHDLLTTAREFFGGPTRPPP
jgi:hypothetical protein